MGERETLLEKLPVDKGHQKVWASAVTITKQHVADVRAFGLAWEAIELWTFWSPRASASGWITTR